MQSLKLAVVHIVRRFRLLKSDETVPENDLFFSVLKNTFLGGIMGILSKFLTGVVIDFHAKREIAQWQVRPAREII